MGALLRQEGLYSCHLSVWRKQREAGELTASAPKKRGPKAKAPDARDREIEELQRKLATSEARLKRAEALLNLQECFGVAESRAAEASAGGGALMEAVSAAAEVVGVAPACAALGICRATYYRKRRPKAEPVKRPSPSSALSPAERAEVLAVLHEPRFADLAPAEVYATLLDEGRYLCSERTMYRVLAENQQVRERRNHLVYSKHAVPEVHATRPNQLWSWDISKLHGPARWTYYSLYVILDVYSRYVVSC